MFLDTVQESSLGNFNSQRRGRGGGCGGGCALRHRRAPAADVLGGRGGTWKGQVWSLGVAVSVSGDPRGNCGLWARIRLYVAPRCEGAKITLNKNIKWEIRKTL